MSMLSDPDETAPQGETAPLADAPASPSSTVISEQPPATQTAPASSQVGMLNPEIDKILRGAIGDVGEGSNLKCLFYGPPGSTKSSMLGDVPNNLIVDLEDGLIAAKSAYVHTGRYLADNVKAYPYKTFDQFDNFVKLLTEGYLPEFEVFSMDTISDWHKREIQDITEKGHAIRPSKSLYKPETDDYTEVNEKITRFIRRIRDMKDRDIILTGHSQTVEPKGRQAKTYLDFSEKLTNKILAMMDVVGYIEMREYDAEGGGKINVPVMRVISDGQIYAKTRIPLPAEIVNPRWVDIKAAWENAKSAGTLKTMEEAEDLAAELIS